MRNVTVAVPDEVYRRARIKAAHEGTSVSALVAAYLRGLAEDDAEFARLADLQAGVQRRIRRFRAGDRLTRDETHARAVR